MHRYLFGPMIFVSLILGAVLGLSGLAGCNSKEARPAALRVQISSEPASLDPSLAEDGMAMRILAATMQGLMAYDSGNKLVPGLAESVSPSSKDGRFFRAKIRANAKWSDGKPVRAADFIFGFNRSLDPSTPGKLVDLLFVIKNARAFHQRQIKSFEQVGIRAISELELEFELERPTAYFPHLLTLMPALPQRRDLTEKNKGRWDWSFPTTGAYRVQKWVDDQLIVLNRNQQFHDTSPTQPETVEMRVITEETTALSLLESDELDLLLKPPYIDLDRLRSEGKVKLFPYFATFYVAPNQKKSVWSKVEARKVFGNAIDREGIVVLIKGDGSPAQTWIPGEYPGRPPVNHEKRFQISEYEQKLGKSQLSNATSDVLLFTFDAGSRNQMIAEKIQADFEKAAGVRLKLAARDWKTHIRELGQGSAGVFRFGWLSPFLDPYAHLMIFHSANPNNYTGWKNDEYDRLLDQISRLPDGSQRREVIARAEHLLVNEQAVVVPVYHYTQTIVVSPRVRSLHINGLGQIDFKSLRIE